ncbi:MAG: DUF3800 domain-containing protein [Candidatus Cybelea sp.]
MPTYLFIDESGTFDFKPERSKFFVLTALMTNDPYQGAPELLRLKHQLLNNPAHMEGLGRQRDLSFFHCTEDPQAVRDQVYQIISALDFQAYSVIVHKNRTNPVLYPPAKFYGTVFTSLINTIVARSGLTGDVQIFASAFTLGSNKAAFLSALRAACDAHSHMTHHIHFHPTPSHHMLQVSDYVSWAIFRKREQGDWRSFDLIAAKVKSEFAIFRHGDMEYY